jgi:CIC family chloride channel protein
LMMSAASDRIVPDEHSIQPNVTKLESSTRFWVLVLLTGAGSGIAGSLLMKLLRAVQHLCYAYGSGDFLRGVEQVSGERRLAAMCAAGLIAGTVLYAIDRFSKTSGGGGLSEAISLRSGRIPEGLTLLKGLLSIVTVGMGAALGREGALKDTGAVIANRLADWILTTPEQRRILVACGAGAGMAAAYNVPLGGAMFAAEILLGSIALATVVPALLASAVGVACSWVLLPDAAAYSVPVMQTSRSLVLWSVVAGPVLGLVSVGYVHTIGWAAKRKPVQLHAAVWPVVAFAAVGLVSLKFPQILGNGKNIVQLTFTGEIGSSLLIGLIVLRPLATWLCLWSGAPGGLFTPTMTLGALLGDATGHLWEKWFGGQQIPGYALIGSSAFLAAATMGPVSSTIFLLELTRAGDALMVPLLLATMGATLTARAFGARSIYSARSD